MAQSWPWGSQVAVKKKTPSVGALTLTASSLVIVTLLYPASQLLPHQSWNFLHPIPPFLDLFCPLSPWTGGKKHEKLELYYKVLCYTFFLQKKVGIVIWQHDPRICKKVKSNFVYVIFNVEACHVDIKDMKSKSKFNYLTMQSR